MRNSDIKNLVLTVGTGGRKSLKASSVIQKGLAQ